MLDWIHRTERGNFTIAMWASPRCGNVDRPIKLGGRRTEPARMSDRSTFLLFILFRQRCDIDFRVCILLLVGGELILSLKLEFKPCLLQLFPQLDVFVY